MESPNIQIAKISAAGPHQNTRVQDSKPGRRWDQKEKDSKITLTKESSHFLPSKFSNSFFKQFDLAMKMKKEELKKYSQVQTEVSEINEGDLVEAFGVTKDQMARAAEIHTKNEYIEKLGTFINMTIKGIWRHKLQQQCRQQQRCYWVQHLK